MNKKILNVIGSLYGKRFCRVAVGKFKSLSLGFGEKIFHNNDRLKDKYYGEWEIGTYYCSWRITRGNKVILGSNDINDINELNIKINSIEFQEIVAINNPSALDVQVVFKDGMVIDFFNTISDNDETFHIFCPKSICIKFTTEGVWEMGKSDAPWPNSSTSAKPLKENKEG